MDPCSQRAHGFSVAQQRLANAARHWLRMWGNVAQAVRCGVVYSRPMELKRVGPYLLERQIARGGMGEVWRARKEGSAGMSRRVALKRIHPHLAAMDGFEAQFLREARLGSWLHHPNAVPVLDVGVDQDGAPWLAMEFVDGVDVRRLAVRGDREGFPLPPELAGYIIHQVLCALEAAHGLHAPNGDAAPLIHRDVSPENVLVDRHGRVLVADFGLAKELLSQEMLTQAGIIKGKLNYMSPEQLKGKQLDGRADLFAVGITFYELLCGKRPYEATNPLMALDQCLAPALRPEEHRAGIPTVLSDLAWRWRHPDVDVRGEDVHHARRLLEDALGPLLRGVNSARLAAYLAHLAGHAETARSADDAYPAPAPRLCGKCGGQLHTQQTQDGAILDRCGDCGGVWLEAEEVRRILGRDVELPVLATLAPLAASPLDEVVGDCPWCRVKLELRPVPGTPPFHIERCQRCHGMWLDEGELERCIQVGLSDVLGRANAS